MTREEINKRIMQACKNMWNENVCKEIEEALEQEPKAKKVIKMRDATPEERESIDKYIKSISTTTGVDFWDLEPSEDAVSRQAVLDLVNADWKYENLESDIENLPSVTPVHIETVTEFADRCRECGREKVLDNIKVEVDVARFIDKDTKLCKNANASGLEVAMQIIDKYKAEMESEK